MLKAQPAGTRVNRADCPSCDARVCALAGAGRAAGRGRGGRGGAVAGAPSRAQAEGQQHERTAEQTGRKWSLEMEAPTRRMASGAIDPAG